MAAFSVRAALSTSGYCQWCSTSGYCPSARSGTACRTTGTGSTSTHTVPEPVEGTILAAFSVRAALSTSGYCQWCLRQAQ
ncbi:MAG: hypothetical protein LBS86_03255, partial [Treponema sp.]|nr:hypothetical protein [Treponema sp.]